MKELKHYKNLKREGPEGAGSVLYMPREILNELGWKRTERIAMYTEDGKIIIEKADDKK